MAQPTGDLYIKQEANATPSPDTTTHDDDLYEETGDLEFFDSSGPEATYNQAYLAKIPTEMWNAWNLLPDNADIEVGTMRQWDVTHPDGTVEHRFRMLLNNQLPQHQLMPREYDLDMALEVTRSTYIFTEEDLPAFKASWKARNDPNQSGMPMHLLRQRPSKEKDTTWKRTSEKKGRFQPYYRKAIPKKTKIAARIQYELGCKPVDNDESQAILQIKQIEAQRPKHTLKIVDHHQISGVIQQGSAAAQAKFGSFVKTTPVNKTTKQKKPANKATRMGEAELRESLLDAFTNRYQYWKMSVLKATFNQPEAYLRQELEKIAILNRSGPHSNEWELKPEFKLIQNQALDESAPDAFEDAEDEANMEDVLPEV